jgi:hypothetical protein
MYKTGEASRRDSRALGTDDAIILVGLLTTLLLVPRRVYQGLNLHMSPRFIDISWASIQTTIVRKMAGDPLTTIGAISSVISILKDTYKAFQQLREFKAFEMVENHSHGGEVTQNSVFLETLVICLHKLEALKHTFEQVLPLEAYSRI